MQGLIIGSSSVLPALLIDEDDDVRLLACPLPGSDLPRCKMISQITVPEEESSQVTPAGKLFRSALHSVVDYIPDATNERPMPAL